MMTSKGWVLVRKTSEECAVVIKISREIGSCDKDFMGRGIVIKLSKGIGSYDKDISREIQ